MSLAFIHFQKTALNLQCFSFVFVSTHVVLQALLGVFMYKGVIEISTFITHQLYFTIVRLFINDWNDLQSVIIFLYKLIREFLRYCFCFCNLNQSHAWSLIYLINCSRYFELAPLNSINCFGHLTNCNHSHFFVLFHQNIY
jgi:hypothetical protein